MRFKDVRKGQWFRYSGIDYMKTAFVMVPPDRQGGGSTMAVGGYNAARRSGELGSFQDSTNVQARSQNVPPPPVDIDEEKSQQELEALTMVVAALEAVDHEARCRIMRYAMNKLGVDVSDLRDDVRPVDSSDMRFDLTLKEISCARREYDSARRSRTWPEFLSDWHVTRLDIRTDLSVTQVVSAWYAFEEKLSAEPSPVAKAQAWREWLQDWVAP